MESNTDNSMTSQGYDQMVSLLKDDDPWKITLPFIKPQVMKRMEAEFEGGGYKMMIWEYQRMIVIQHTTGIDYEELAKLHLDKRGCSQAVRDKVLSYSRTTPNCVPDNIHCYIDDMIIQELAEANGGVFPQDSFLFDTISYDSVIDKLGVNRPWGITLEYLRRKMKGKLTNHSVLLENMKRRKAVYFLHSAVETDYSMLAWEHIYSHPIMQSKYLGYKSFKDTVSAIVELMTYEEIRSIDSLHCYIYKELFRLRYLLEHLSEEDIQKKADFLTDQQRLKLKELDEKAGDPANSNTTEPRSVE
jgi:hypothetical protein